MNFNVLQVYEKPVNYMRFKLIRSVNFLFYESPIYSCAACGWFF